MASTCTLSPTSQCIYRPTEFSSQRRATHIFDICDHDLGVLTREAANAGLANALRATREDTDAACQPEGDLRCT